MGLTIHYKGKLNHPELISQVIEELKDISLDMDWRFHILDEDLDKPNTSYIEENGVIRGYLPFKGIIITMHQKSEALILLFDKNGILRHIIPAPEDYAPVEEPYISVKTQFAPIEVHIGIIKLLKYLKEKYIHNLTVYDEGDYWDTEDKKLLRQKLDFLNQKISELGDALSAIPKDVDDTPESIVEKIEEALKKMFNKNRKCE
jgi:hypothetical protein